MGEAFVFYLFTSYFAVRLFGYRGVYGVAEYRAILAHIACYVAQALFHNVVGVFLGSVLIEEVHDVTICRTWPMRSMRPMRCSSFMGFHGTS